MAVRIKEANTYYKPVNITQSVSIAASGNAMITVNIPAGRRYYIKQLIISKDTDVTVDSNGVIVDDVATQIRQTNGDLTAYFGVPISADRTITLSGTNANATTAENLTLQVIGFEVEAV